MTHCRSEKQATYTRCVPVKVATDEDVSRADTASDKVVEIKFSRLS